MVLAVNVTCKALIHRHLGLAVHWVLGMQLLYYYDMANDNDYNKMSSTVFTLAFEVFYCPLHL